MIIVLEIGNINNNGMFSGIIKIGSDSNNKSNSIVIINDGNIC